MNKKISLGAAITYMAIIAAMVYSFTSINAADVFNKKMIDIESRQKLYDTLTEIDRWVRDSYYGDVSDNELLQGAAQGYLTSLGDNYSQFLTAEEYQRYKNVESDQYTGIGVATKLSEEGYILITNVYPDSPAYYANVAVGDLFVEVDGTSVNNDNFEELEESLRGATGTKVSLVKRTTAGDSTLELIRRDVDVPTVETTSFDNILYINILEITSATAKQVERALATATNNGQNAYIVDLRGINSTNVAYIADFLDVFAPEGDTIFAKYDDNSMEPLAQSKDSNVSQPIIVLVDAGTKGTPEILAQYIKEMPNGSTVGVTTAGYGSIQQDFKLSDGSAIILTTAMYCTPTGVIFDKIGVSPSYEITWIAEDVEKDFLFGNPDTDPQLRKAIEVSVAMNTAIN